MKTKVSKLISVLLVAMLCIVPTVAYAGYTQAMVLNAGGSSTYYALLGWETYVFAQARYQILGVPQGVSNGEVAHQFFAGLMNLDRTFYSSWGNQLDIVKTDGVTHYSSVVSSVQFIGRYQGRDNATGQYFGSSTGTTIYPNYSSSTRSMGNSKRDAVVSEEEVLVALVDDLGLSSNAITLFDFIDAYADQYDAVIGYAMAEAATQGDMMPLITIQDDGSVRVSVKKANGYKHDSVLSVSDGVCTVISSKVDIGQRLEIQETMIEALQK